jgi:hypothetical protein
MHYFHWFTMEFNPFFKNRECFFSSSSVTLFANYFSRAVIYSMNEIVFGA